MNFYKLTSEEIEKLKNRDKKSEVKTSKKQQKRQIQTSEQMNFKGI